MRWSSKMKLGFAGAAMATTALAAPTALAQSAEDLRSQVFALQQRVDALENRGGVKAAPGTTFEFGGYVKLDFIYDFEQDFGGTGPGISINGSEVAVNSPDDGGFFAQARESRFNVKSTTQTDTGPVTALIEFDFFNTEGNELISNSNNARLRLAYGTWNGILAGQNWSLFMPIAFGAPQVNFSGPAGTVFLRHPQVRYTFPKMETTAGTFTFAASLESSEFSGRTEDGSVVFAPSLGSADPKTDQLPDFIGAVDWTNGVQRAKAALMLTQLNSPDSLRRAGLTTSSGDSDIGYGISLAWATPLWAGSDFRGSFQYGDGIGRYIQNGIGNAAVIEADGEVNTVEAWGGMLSLTQDLTDTISISATGGLYKVEDTFRPDDLEELNTAGVTLFYKPNSKVTIGTQLLWARRENADGAEEAASRWQTSFQFRF